jgi:hypothetical protein
MCRAAVPVGALWATGETRLRDLKTVPCRPAELEQDSSGCGEPPALTWPDQVRRARCRADHERQLIVTAAGSGAW